jgi:hypothetical protein
MSEIQPALLTRLELEWLLGKISNLSKKTERDLRYRINKKVRIFMHTELPLLKDRGFAAALGKDAAAISSGNGVGHYPGCTIRSSIADARVAFNETKSRQREGEEYEKRMLRPGFEPGISDSKGRYA